MEAIIQTLLQGADKGYTPPCSLQTSKAIGEELGRGQSGFRVSLP